MLAYCQAKNIVTPLRMIRWGKKGLAFNTYGGGGLGTGTAWCRTRLCFISGNLAGRSLARIVEEELIAVGIIDH
jgi:hypothetical protein